MDQSEIEDPAASGPARTGRFGMHLTLDGYAGDPGLLGDGVVIRQWLEELPRDLGMTKLMEPYLVEVSEQNEKDPGGITGFILIAQSHISIHTFPRRGFLTADIFTCQDDLDTELVERSLTGRFAVRDVDVHLLERGTGYPLDNLPHAPESLRAPAVRQTGSPFLERRVEHIDIARHDTRSLLDSMGGMSFTARELSRSAEICARMLRDPDCAIILTIAGSTGAAGCLRLYADLVAEGMVDIVVATGAAVTDMDFLEALGHGHYHGSPLADDQALRRHRIDRIYDTYIDDHDLQACDHAIQEVADGLPPEAYSSRAFIRAMGRWLAENPDRARNERSLVQTCYEMDVPVFCPAFSDSCAGFGLVAHQMAHPDRHVMIDSVRDFRELTELKIAVQQTGLIMVGGGVPKNFAQDTVTCAEALGHPVPMHRYSVQITVADVRDGACSSSTLKEAGSWGKVDADLQQMVYAEATLALPLLAGALYHDHSWRPREPRRLARRFGDG